MRDQLKLAKEIVMKEQDHHQESTGSKSKAKTVVEEAFLSDDDDDEPGVEILEVAEEDDKTFYIHKPILQKATDNSSSNSISIRNSDFDLERHLKFDIMNSLLEIINPTSSGNLNIHHHHLPQQVDPPPPENFDDQNETSDGGDDEFIKYPNKTNNPLGKVKYLTSPTQSHSSSLIIIENGQSSNSNSTKDDQSCFDCEICVETKSASECFGVKGCRHAYIVSKLKENITNIGCPVPDCQGFLDPDYCCSIIPPMMFKRWGFALCEGAIPEYEKFYCPHRDCSALLIDDGKKITGQWECPHCKRMFCVQCKVPWHDSITCEEFQRNNVNELGKEDGILIYLAETKQWRRCPSCNYFVEKVRGCMYVKCSARNKGILFWLERIMELVSATGVEII
ncbi:uncharacterized protein LOC107423805 isoform X2 [Ziziphus jujuba]|uniref:RBR-type E3 ubiquitin transferase n=1 Tax=Ziziphus jujuba TaxID=326968 RepID=A0A6P4A650_ZIZJJ|nr:uncharacterized protein LOC107423805 isoform X2 [Ziziphus jujuba]